VNKDTWVITDGEVYVAVVRERKGLFEVTVTIKDPEAGRERKGYPDSLFHSFGIKYTLELSDGEATFSTVPRTVVDLDTPQTYYTTVWEETESRQVPIFTYTRRELIDFLVGTTGRSGKSPLVRLLEEMVRRINSLNFSPSNWEYRIAWEKYKEVIYQTVSSVMLKISERLPEDVRVFLFEGEMSFKGTLPTFELASVSFTGDEFQVTLRTQPARIELSIPLMVTIPVDLLMRNQNIIEEVRSTLKDAFTNPEIFGDVSKWFIEVYLSSIVSEYIEEFFTYPPQMNIITNSLFPFVRRKLSEKGVTLDEWEVRSIVRALSSAVLDLFSGYVAGRSFKFTSGTVSVLDVSVDSWDNWTDVVGKVYSTPVNVSSWEKFFYTYVDLTHFFGRTQYFGDKTTNYTYFIIVSEVHRDVDSVRKILDELEKKRPSVQDFLLTYSFIVDKVITDSIYSPVQFSVGRGRIASIDEVMKWVNENLREEGE